MAAMTAGLIWVEAYRLMAWMPVRVAQVQLTRDRAGEVETADGDGIGVTADGGEDAVGDGLLDAAEIGGCGFSLPNPSPQGGGAPPAAAPVISDGRRLDEAVRPGLSPLVGEMGGSPEGVSKGSSGKLTENAVGKFVDGGSDFASSVEAGSGLSSGAFETGELAASGFPLSNPFPQRAEAFGDRQTLQRIAGAWFLQARAEQRAPGGRWRHWLLMGGRGSGKTRAGAEWVHALASAGERSALRIALVAETLGDAREVMVDGLSGICRVAKRSRPEVEISRRRLIWPNGTVAQLFSSEDPESLRGPQFHFAWCDELAKWKYAEETFDMLQFCLRLGEGPRLVATTTPRPVPLIKRLMADAATVVTRISTRSNRDHLAPDFIAAMEARYAGSRLGRQELDGELIEDREDALWRRDRLEALVVKNHGALRRIVIGVDPPSGTGAASCCGIVAAGVDEAGLAVVLADGSVEGMSPAGWAGAVVRLYHRFEADRVVAEVNQGGAMVAEVLKSVEAGLPVTMVRATRGKFLRAEPVAAFYEQGRVVHAGRFSALEDQMCDFGPDGLSSGRSPDRLDALVWALTALMLDVRGVPRVRGM